jgi:hypothetical protein
LRNTGTRCSMVGCLPSCGASSITTPASAARTN